MYIGIFYHIFPVKPNGNLFDLLFVFAGGMLMSARDKNVSKNETFF